MEAQVTTFFAPADRWSDLERWSLRAQALAEIGALSRRDHERELAAEPPRISQTIVLP